MAGKFLYIRNDQWFCFRPARTANTPAPADPGTRYRPLEWRQHQLIVFYKIKADPKPAKLLLQCRGRIRQISHQIWLSLQQTLYLWDKRLVLFFFCSGMDG